MPNNVKAPEELNSSDFELSNNYSGTGKMFDTVKGNVSPVSQVQGLNLNQTDFNLGNDVFYLGDLGKSRYDRNVSTETAANISNFRGQQQPWYAQLGAGLGKGLVNFGTVASDGIIGTALGLGNMLLKVPEEGLKFKNFWDNPYSNKMNDIRSKSDEWFKQYYTDKELAAQQKGTVGAFLSQMLTPNFWGNMISNTGFMGGMVVDGILTGGAVEGIVGAKQIASKLPAAIAWASQTGDKGLQLAIESENALGITNEVIKNAKALQNANRTSQGLSMILGAQGMSRMNAIGDSKQFYDENRQKLDEQHNKGEVDDNKYSEKLKQLDDARIGLGNASYVGNLVVNAVSQGLQFKNLFTKGFNPTKNIANSIEGDIERGYTTSSNIPKDVLKIGKNILAQGVWGMQGMYLAGKIPTDYYQKKFDGKQTDTLDDIFKSVYKGLSDTYGTRAGWDQGLIGSLMGAIGLPGITHNHKTGESKIGWQGGIWGDLKEVKEEHQANVDATNKLNETIKSPDFQNNYRSLIRSMSLEGDKNQAAWDNNKFEVLNKQHEQFVNDALNFIQAGKYNDFVDNIKAIKNSEASEVRELFKTKPETLEDKILKFHGVKPSVDISEEQKPFVDSYKEYTDDALLSKINKNAEEMLKVADSIKKLSDSYDIKYPEITHEAKEGLIYTATTLDDLNKRINDINKESISKTGVDIYSHAQIEDLPDNKFQVNLDSYANAYNESMQDRLNKGIITTEESKALKDKVDDLPQLLTKRHQFLDAYRFYLNKDAIDNLIEETKKIKDKEEKKEQKKAQEIIKEDLSKIYPNIDDRVTDNNGELHRVEDINEKDGSYTITPINDDGDKIGESKVVQSTDIKQIPIIPKDLELEPTENTNEGELPSDLEKPIGQRTRGLKEVASSLSHSHTEIDPTTNRKETVVKNKDFDKHVSSSSNDLKGDSIELKVDTTPHDEYTTKLWEALKSLKDRVDKKTPLSKDEINKWIGEIRLTQGEDRFNSWVDRIPISALYKNAKGEEFSKGLYYHDSDYSNILIPREVEAKGPLAVNDYIKQQKEFTRQNRKVILQALLSGKEVKFLNIKKTKGVPNNTKVNHKIDEILKENPNNIKLGVATAVGNMWTGDNTPDIEGRGNPGNVFFLTNKTCNGETGVIKTNISKLSKEHSDILFDAIVTRFKKDSGGRFARMKDPRIEGLNVGQVIDLLTLFGPATNINDAETKLRKDYPYTKHLENKQLFFDPATKLLHYGTNTLHFPDLYSGKLSYQEEKKKFIDWATKNKNYIVYKRSPKDSQLGIELNKPLKLQFKIGNWESDGTDNYAGSLIKHELITTNVEEFEGTGSLFHAPLIMLDLSESGLKIENNAKTDTERVTTTKKVKEASEKKTTRPKNTGSKKIEASEQLVIKDKQNKVDPEVLRSLPVGSTLYMTTTRTYEDEEGKPITETRSKPLVEVEDFQGKKNYKLVHPGAKIAFGINASSKEDHYVEVNDDAVDYLYKYIKESKSDFHADTSILKQPVTEEVVELPKSTSIDINDVVDPLDVRLGGVEDPLAMQVQSNDILKGYKQWDQKKELKWLHDKLGEQNVRLTNGLIDLAREGKQAFGLFRNNLIQLSDIAKEGVAYHEAFHRVSLLYLSSEQKDNIYEEARKKYSLPESYSDKDVEEYLAEEFRNYIINRNNNRPTNILGRIKEFFSNLYHYIRNVFTGNQRLTNLDINKLFNSIEEGRFRNYKPNSDSLDKLGDKSYALIYRGEDLKNVDDYNHFKDIVKGLASIATQDLRKQLLEGSKTEGKYSNIDILESAKSIDFDRIKKDLQTYVNNLAKLNKANHDVITAIEKGQISPELASQLKDKYKTEDISSIANKANLALKNGLKWHDLYQEVLDHYDDIYKEQVQDYIHTSLGLRKTSGDDEGEDISLKEIGNYDKASYEYDGKNNILGSIKFLISNLHKDGVWNPSTNTFDYAINQKTGMYDFAPFDEVWNRLMTDLHGEDTIEDMIKILDDNKSYSPYYQLSKKLKSGSEILRTQFEVSFRKHRNSFINALFKYTMENDKFNYSFYFNDADVQAQSNQIKNTWGEMFAKSSLFEDDKLDINKLNQISNEFNQIKNEFSNNKDLLINTKEYKDRLINLLGKLSISIDNNTLDVALSNIIKSGKASTDNLALSALMNEISLGIFNTKFGTLYKYANDPKSKLEARTLFRNESLITKLSIAFAQSNPEDNSNTIPGPDGGNHYVYSDHSFVTDVIRQLTKEDGKYLNKLLSDPFSQSSIVLNELKNNKNIQVKTFNSFLRESTGDSGREYLKISPVEDFLLKLNMTTSGYMLLPTLADRKSYYIISGLERNKITLEKDINGKLQVPDKIIDIFYNYAKAERDRIQRAEDTWNRFRHIDDSKLVENYHYVKEGREFNKHKGLAYEYQLFNSFNKKGFIFDRDAKDEIRNILNDKLEETIDKAKDLGIIDIDSKGKVTNAPLLDNNIIDNLAKDYNGDRDAAIKSILSDFTINTMIGSIESMHLFTGDIAFYKPDPENFNSPIDDYEKRLSVLTSSGTPSRDIVPGEDDSSTYTISTISRQRIRSKFYDIIRAKQEELLRKKYAGSVSSEFINKLLDKYLVDYTKVDPNDAQVYLSPEMFRKISIKEGNWSPDKEKAFELLNSTKPITEVEEQQLLDIVLQPLKHVYFDRLPLNIDDSHNILVPTFDKMSEVTLFRRYVAGTYMEDVLDRMESKGKYSNLPKIDMLKTETAVKVGNRLRTNLFNNPGGEDPELGDLSSLATYDQNFAFLKHQVITDPHDVTRTTLGTQFKKLGLLDVVPQGDYTINGKNKKGKDIQVSINKSLSELSNRRTKRLLSKLGVDSNMNMNEKLFYDNLYKEAKKSNLPYNTLEAIRLHTPIDALADADWIFAKFISQVNKSAIDTEFPGNQLIQVSGYGMGLKGIKNKWDKTNNLRFIFDDKYNIKGIEAKVSIGVFKNVIPSNLKTFEDKVKWLKDNQHVLEGLGYRIPTQGQNSSVPITVVDFLPEQLGDAIILPNEFTALTGSDFDVDKLYFVRYNYKISNNIPIKEEFLDDSNSSIEERYNNIANEAFLDNRHIFDRESYDKLKEVKSKLYDAIKTKSNLMGEDGELLSTLFDTFKLLNKNIRENTGSTKDWYIDQSIEVSNKIDDLLFYKELVLDLSNELGEYKDIIKDVLTSKNIIPTIGDFKSLSLYEQNTTKAIENDLIDHYRGVLLSESNFLNSSTPLGIATNVMKNIATKIEKAEQKTKGRTSLDFTTPSFNHDIKYKYGTGKFGIGPSALNLVHHAMSQVANLELSPLSTESTGLVWLKDHNLLSLHEIDALPTESGEILPISSWLSGLEDLHVDIAKDPKIISLNVVKPTYNVTYLLTRLGLGQKVFEFMPQPILKNLVKESINEGSSSDSWRMITRKFDDKPIDRVRVAWNNKLNDSIRANNTTKKTIEDKLQGYNPFEDNLLKLITTSDSERTPEFYYKQLLILDLFNKLNEGPARWLNELVMASRVDTKKYGNNLTEIKLYLDSLNKVIGDDRFTNLDSLISLYDKDNSSFLSTYLNNSASLIPQLFANKTIAASPIFNELIDTIKRQNKLSWNNNPSLVNDISKELKSAFFGRFFSSPEYLNLDNRKVSILMNSVVNFIENVSERYPELRDNALIKSLVKGITYQEKDLPAFLGIPSIKSNDNMVREDLTFAWQELLHSDKQPIKDFAKRLFIYSYYTSGFRRGIFSIHSYIPSSLMHELEIVYKDLDTKQESTSILSYSDYIKDLTYGLNDPGQIPYMIEKVLDDVYQNNWDDSRYVEQVNFHPFDTSIVTVSPTNNQIVFGTFRIKPIEFSEDTSPIFKPYIHYIVDDKTSYLMKNIGYMATTGLPVYMTVEKKGYSSKGRVIKEYGLDNTFLERNKVVTYPEDKVYDIMSKLKYYKDEFVSKEPVVKRSSEGGIDIPLEQRSLNVASENSQIEGSTNKDLLSDKESLRQGVKDAGIYTELEQSELIDMIDKTPINSLEDLSKLNEKICNWLTSSPGMKYSKNPKNKYSIKD